MTSGRSITCCVVEMHSTTGVSITFSIGERTGNIAAPYSRCTSNTVRSQPPYLLNIARYIHANPVLHGLIDDPGQWAFSNYVEWVANGRGCWWIGHSSWITSTRPRAIGHSSSNICGNESWAEYLQTLDG